MIATTGFFDGVHLGHRLVIERLVSLAHARGDESLVVTFWPHPRAVLQDGARELRLLNSLEEKKELLRVLGVDRVEVLDFTRSFAALTAEQYLREILRDRFGVTTLLMGYDNRLGSDRLTAASLKPIADGMGMELMELSPLSFRPSEASGEISSTQIRAALEEGDITSAAEMLGYGYALKGVVVAGNRLGRTIGFPTANMKLYEPLKLVPGRGVYAVRRRYLWPAAPDYFPPPPARRGAFSLAGSIERAAGKGPGLLPGTKIIAIFAKTSRRRPGFRSSAPF